MQVTWTFIVILTTYLVSSSQVVAQNACSGDRLQQSNGRVWLETQRPLYVGQVTRVAAIVCSTDYPIVLQIWESSTSGGQSGSASYKLLWHTTLQPSKLQEVEIFDLKATDYFEVKPSHRIGLSTSGDFVNEPISVLRKFDSTFVQLVSSNEAGPFETNGVYTFSDIQYPGMFYIELCGSEECPILQFPTRAPPPPNNVPCTEGRSNEGKVKLERSRPLATGTIRAIRTTFCNSNPVKIQLWQAAGDSDEFTLVWEKTADLRRPGGESPVDEMQEVVINLAENEYINVDDTYRLGLQTVNDVDVMPIPKKFSTIGGNIVTSGTGDEISLCESLVFDELAFPEEYYLELCKHLDCADNGRPDTTHTEPCNQMTTLQGTAAGSQSSAASRLFVDISVATCILSSCVGTLYALYLARIQT